MRRATRNGVIAVAAASGAMAVALPVSAAFAAEGAGADGTAAGSPGLVSGNGIQLPVHVPVNVCGNTVNVVGLLNPAAGNACANTGGAKAGGAGKSGGSDASGGASAHGAATDSPGVLSGNGVQLPVDLPVNVSGNSVNVIGVGNPAIGNESVNGPVDQPRRPPRTPAAPGPRAPKPPAHARSHAARPAAATLAHTGADLTAPAVAGSAALLVAGATLYRRFRPGRTD
ncbi:chaplin [Streptomyces sp. Caat 7-52]|uniref:chaplin n=1 Tax=Streptomyces sp. Caat 7-52 TaxID=2949637 RepID=UPI0020363D2E|nr:chaplin [Streptomyces sp. Caat 7-52]